MQTLMDLITTKMIELHTAIKNDGSIPDVLKKNKDKFADEASAFFRPVVGMPEVTHVGEKIGDVSGSRTITSENMAWVSARLIAEPRIRTFNAVLKESTVIVFYFQTPPDFYNLLEALDLATYRKLKETNRVSTVTRVTDLLGDSSRTLARERTVIFR